MSNIKSYSRSHQVPKNQFYKSSFNLEKKAQIPMNHNRRNQQGFRVPPFNGVHGYHSVSPNLSDSIKIETRPRRNEFSQDSNWLSSIQNLKQAWNGQDEVTEPGKCCQKIFDSSLGKKIQRDVFQLIDEDESNLYDPTVENSSPISKKSGSGCNLTQANKGKCKLKVSLSTQPTQGGESFGFSHLNFDKNLQEIFCNDQMDIAGGKGDAQGPHLEDQDTESKGGLEGEASLEKRFNPFRAQDDDEIKLKRAKFERLDF